MEKGRDTLVTQPSPNPAALIRLSSATLLTAKPECCFRLSKETFLFFRLFDTSVNVLTLIFNLQPGKTAFR